MHGAASIAILAWCLFPSLALGSETAAKVGGDDDVGPWIVHYGSTQSDHSSAITLDEDGDVYVVGYTYGDMFGADASPSNGQPIAMKLSRADGSLLWGVQTQTARQSYGELVTTYGGDVFIAGVTSDSLYAKNNYNTDIFVLCRDTSDGTEKWGIQIGSTENEYVIDMAVDSTGVYILAEAKGSLYATIKGSSDTMLVKVSLAGQFLWGRQFGVLTEDYPYGLTLLSSEVIQVFGQSNEVVANVITGYPYSALFYRSSGILISIEESEYMPEAAADEVVRDGAKYMTYRGRSADVVVTRNPCRAGTILTESDHGTAASCVNCLSGQSSEDYSTSCRWCDGGSSSEEGGQCQQCPAGTYSYSGDPCRPCTGYHWSQKGSRSCLYYSWKMAPSYEALSTLFYSFGIVLLGSTLLLYLLDLPIGDCYVILVSVLNVLSDQLYVATVVFKHASLLYLCLIFVLPPVIHFVYRVLRLCQFRKHYQLRILLKRPVLQAPLLRLSVRDGLPVWGEVANYSTPGISSVVPAPTSEPSEADGAPAVAGESSSRSGITTGSANLGTGAFMWAWSCALLQQTLYAIGWSLFHLAYCSPWYIFHSVFYCCFFVLGFYLYHFKLLYVKRVEVWWTEWLFGTGPLPDLWTAGGEAGKSVDKPAANGAFLCEVMAESIPQCVVQSLNNALMMEWPIVAVISMVATCLSIVLHVYRVAYWHAWRCVSLSRIPLWDASAEELEPYVESGPEVNNLLHERSGTGNGRGGASGGGNESGHSSEGDDQVLQLRAPEVLEMRAQNAQLLAEQKELRRQLAMLTRRLGPPVAVSGVVEESDESDNCIVGDAEDGAASEFVDIEAEF